MHGFSDWKRRSRRFDRVLMTRSVIFGRVDPGCISSRRKYGCGSELTEIFGSVAEGLGVGHPTARMTLPNLVGRARDIVRERENARAVGVSVGVSVSARWRKPSAPRQKQRKVC
jgi:hypothetical protein